MQTLERHPYEQMIHPRFASAGGVRPKAVREWRGPWWPRRSNIRRRACCMDRLDTDVVLTDGICGWERRSEVPS